MRIPSVWCLCPGCSPDRVIAGIAQRDGVARDHAGELGAGAELAATGAGAEITVDLVAEAIDITVCQIAGDARHVGLPVRDRLLRRRPGCGSALLMALRPWLICL